MITDSELKIKGYAILRKELAEDEAEKFISLVIKILSIIQFGGKNCLKRKILMN